MGRRAISTTKSGKYMNPADQTRKEARKKELKKNKKQRQIVRTAVLKNKDAIQIIEELEKVDQMEFNPLQQPPPLNEKVLREKRKKLRETLDRVLRLMNREEPDKWVEMKKFQSMYEKKRAQLIAYFEAVQTAQTVTVDEIPLPDMPALPATKVPTSSALKKNTAKAINKKCPGVPLGPPPILTDDSESDDDSNDNSTGRDAAPSDEKREVAKPKTIRFSDEHVAQKSHEDTSSSTPRLEDLSETAPESQRNPFFSALTPSVEPNSSTAPGRLVRMPPGPPPGLPSGLGIVAAPPLFPNVRMPNLQTSMPPPPPPMSSSSFVPSVSRIVSKPQQHNHQHQSQVQKPRFSSTSQPNQSTITDPTGKTTTIYAKPRIRNLSTDITRFVPTALKVKKDDFKRIKISYETPFSTHAAPKQTDTQAPTKDDAYLQFMKEMQNLI